ncbi:HAD family hydrolase [Nocardia nova]|uniref:HAD family hydrolase n=1 Tax=Nocardia nova TaxID=37330 RepID=UPI001894BC3D|nr:HAD family hydrolase [Nocardia nova]MBF6150343.1 HAD hydrolase-like protein [Nocardia nova]
MPDPSTFEWGGVKKVLIFDLDGVVITYEKIFAESYSQKYGIDVSKVQEFFVGEYYGCAIGIDSLVESIEKYLTAWNWPGSASSLIDYWFDCHSRVDADLLRAIGSARSAGCECYVASDLDRTRAVYVSRLLDIENNFDGRFFSCEIGAVKTEPRFFDAVLTVLECDPEWIWFWDDNHRNVATARTRGVNARLYTGYRDFADCLPQILTAAHTPLTHHNLSADHE